MYRETSGGDYKWFEDHPLPRHPSTVLVTAKDRRREFASRDQIPVGWKLSDLGLLWPFRAIHVIYLIFFSKSRFQVWLMDG